FCRFTHLTLFCRRSHISLLFHPVMHSSLVPPSLYLFPTRRSSDLLGIEFAFGHRATDCTVGSSEVVITTETDDGTETNHIADRVDRKSTRLNSSHVSISYAVFCLKKKIENRLCRLFSKYIAELTRI